MVEGGDTKGQVERERAAEQVIEKKVWNLNNRASPKVIRKSVRMERDGRGLQNIHTPQ